jgi:hypothetical protein
LTQLSNRLTGAAALERKGLISYSSLARRRTGNGPKWGQEDKTQCAFQMLES